MNVDDDQLAALHALGAAYRSNWNEFDGRTLRSQLTQWIDGVIRGNLDPVKYLDDNGIHTDPYVHWYNDCDVSECGREPE